LDRKNVLIALSLITLAAVPVVVALTEHPIYYDVYDMRNMRMGWRPHGFIQVSTEFKNHVISIASNDEDVQTLLNDGYNATGVSPIINYTINANGDVTMKAANAIVVLRKSTRGIAYVWVNVETEKVTRIATSRTVIR